MPIPVFITTLTGITDEMVNVAPKFDEVIAGIPGFYRRHGPCRTTHFDMQFLNHEIGLVYEDYRLLNPCLVQCTCAESCSRMSIITN
jgi:DNA polymerase III epsilon subunit-like protein